MKSNKQRRTELGTARGRRQEKKLRKAAFARSAEVVPVNAELLCPTNSYGVPDYVTRGYYLDVQFICKDCGQSQTWTATQQKWWYEVAKGDVFSRAARCRPCRRRERERIARARTTHLEGLAKKKTKQ